MQCKYCLEDIEINMKNNMIHYPCDCKNPVHVKCLDKWNDTRTSNFTKCEICNTEYKNIKYKYCYKCRMYNNIYKMYLYVCTICFVTIIYILLYEYKIIFKVT